MAPMLPSTTSSPSPSGRGPAGARARGRRWRTATALVTSVVVAACSAGGVSSSAAGTKGPRASAPPPSESMYCRAVAGAAPPDVASAVDAAALSSAWRARRTYEHGAAIVAPGAVQGAWRVVSAFSRDQQEPALEQARYSPSALLAEPAEVSAARQAIREFDRDVCGVTG